MKILIINGPNLNMLGIREPALYGRQDYPALEEYCRTACRELSAQYSCEVECEIFQSNYEGALVEKIQQAYFDHTEGIVINPAAYTHTSVAILDALKAAAVPAAEVHLTDIRERDGVTWVRLDYTDLYYDATLEYLVRAYGKGEVQYDNCL